MQNVRSSSSGYKHAHTFFVMLDHATITICHLKKDGFNPEDEYKSKHKTVEKSKGRAKDIHVKEKSIVDKATEVFTRVPTLAALFREILACQGLSTVLNVLFVTKLKEVIPDDGDRAGYMGKVSIQFFY